VSLFARAGFWRATPIRVRLALALGLGLAPVLILGGVQAAIQFRHESRDRQAEVASAAQRGVAVAQARIADDEVLLRTLAAAPIGSSCGRPLTEINQGIPRFVNLIRFDDAGRATCAAVDPPADPGRQARPWFRAVAAGDPAFVTSDAGAAYADQPALLVSVRATDEGGRFGVLTGVVTLASLRAQVLALAAPAKAEVALADGSGRLLSASRPRSFPATIGARELGPAQTAPLIWRARDREGADRLLSSSPIVGGDIFLVISARSPGVLSWARINRVAAIGLPLLAFLLPLLAVGAVAERGIVRWIAYLRRIATIYAGGRYGVHPVRAETAPPEIRALAGTLDLMAQTVAARDALVAETMVQKDDLLREIHHRVKNNLQVISSLLSLQQRAVSDQGAREVLADTRQRIGALALIYRALYQGPDLKRVDLGDFLRELIAQTILGEEDGALIRTELEIDAVTIDADRLAPLALFAVEAITNSRKQGLDRAGGVLSVRFRVRGEHAELTVSDTGVVGAVAVSRKGVGPTLMTAFARQLRGEASFHPNAEGGLTTCLTFPVPASAIE